MTAGKPFITANRVTVLRLLPMPLVAYLVYQGEAGWWTGLGLGAVIASTDFVDGLLARKHGPTVLGALLDPIADKVFIALTYLPLVDLGYFPAWLVALLFAREFIVTALRSAYEQRGISLRTSFLSKIKTWVQMQGLGFLMLAALVDRTLMLTVLLAITGVPLAIGLAGLVAKKVWHIPLIMGVAMGLLTALYALPSGLPTTIEWALYVIVGLTWVSGLDYLVGGLPRLYEAGGFGRADVVRLLGALAIPLLAVFGLVHTGAHPAPLMGLIAIELSVGGLDNLLSHHRASAGAIAWPLRTLGASALMAAAFFVATPSAATWLATAAFAVSLLGVAREFWRGRTYYLAAALRNEAAPAEAE